MKVWYHGIGRTSHRAVFRTAAATLASAIIALFFTRPMPLHAEPAAPRGDPASGSRLFERNCAGCHGIEGTGGRGPNLHRPVLAHASNVEEIAAVITTGITPDMPASPFLSEAELTGLATYVYSLGRLPPVAVPGDAAKGRLIFERSGCLSCHILRGEGNGYGPELTNIGGVRSADRLRQTLLDPKSTLPKDFLLVEVVTPTGQTLRGVRRNEDTLTLQLQDVTGTFYSVEKSQLRSLSRLTGETPMPSFGKTLSKRQLDDLVAYLVQQGQTP